MISFENLILESGSPIYLQIIRHMKRGIIAGTIRDRDEMPSRRILSALLGLNPNTIQKAYRLLEEERIIQSHSGAKSYVTIGEEQIRQIRLQLLEGDVRTLAAAMKQMGVSKDEALRLVERIWTEEGDGE